MFLIKGEIIMSAINSVTLVGRVVREPKRFDHNGNTNIIIDLAIDNGRKDANGKSLADFVPVQGTIFATHPTRMFDYVHGRDMIAVQGHLESYKDKRNYTQQVIKVDNVEYLAKYKGNKNAQQPQDTQQPEQPDMPDEPDMSYMDEDVTMDPSLM